MNRDRLLARVFPEVEAPYSIRDTMLYALGVGAAQDPLDTNDLRFVFEKNLQALPSMSCVLAHPGAWLMEPELEVKWVKLLHAEQSFELVRPLPPQGTVVGSYRITGIVDKGPESGALLYLEKSLKLPDGTPVGTVGSTYFLRGDGGGGHWGERGTDPQPVPDREPDGVIDTRTLPIAALIYRLSGDYNPLHADPEIARKAGFEKPILHGLCTYGVACQSLVRALCAHDATRLRAMNARFTRPVYPGETLRTQWWSTDASGVFRFRCLSVERGEVVLDRGSVRVAD